MVVYATLRHQSLGSGFLVALIKIFTVNSHQVADKIRRDERVCVIERTNLRYLSELPQKVDLVTLDLSFISILLVSLQTPVKSFLAIFTDF